MYSNYLRIQKEECVSVMTLNPCEVAKQSLRIREKHGDEPIDLLSHRSFKLCLLISDNF